MPKWYEQVPEWACVRNGDPYLAEIVKADDIIDDHRHNADLLGLERGEADAIAQWVECARLRYELAVLDAWWAR